MWKKYCRAGQTTDDNIVRLRKDAIHVAIRSPDCSARSLAYVEYAVPITQETGFTDEISTVFCVALISNYLSLSPSSVPISCFLSH